MEYHNELMNTTENKIQMNNYLDMKRKLTWSVLFLTLITLGAFAQDIPQSQVPAVVINSFQQKYPQAKRVDWELKNGIYEAEFETGLFGADHEVWLQSNGTIVRHKEDFAKNDLPQAVLTQMKRDFAGYRMEDVKKITEGQRVSYAFEMKNRTAEWKLIVDKQGNILEKRAD
ncbi:PepSY-like domain-containing protein [Sphingobacterium sp. N143]|uniref:PepSY-like domain-containing protein n=1 Tax=Sphingobacterium sp. N143 TaxID=2746727 RepID=UPI0025764DED|nr:PepSY-like domain-containing protein [Sphingobacterium sp. N143]MDM1296853.1 PepSY-like domain-containing protein [Sphingobacterium sp. N143]